MDCAGFLRLSVHWPAADSLGQNSRIRLSGDCRRYLPSCFSRLFFFTLFLFNCLLLLLLLSPVLAAAVFAFRAENLMEVTSSSSAEVCLSRNLFKAVPVLPISTISKATCVHPSSSQEEEVQYTVKMPVVRPSSQRGRTYYNTALQPVIRTLSQRWNISSPDSKFILPPFRKARGGGLWLLKDPASSLCMPSRVSRECVRGCFITLSPVLTSVLLSSLTAGRPCRPVDPESDAPHPDLSFCHLRVRILKSPSCSRIIVPS